MESDSPMRASTAGLAGCGPGGNSRPAATVRLAVGLSPYPAGGPLAAQRDRHTLRGAEPVCHRPVGSRTPGRYSDAPRGSWLATRAEPLCGNPAPGVQSFGRRRVRAGPGGLAGPDWGSAHRCAGAGRQDLTGIHGEDIPGVHLVAAYAHRAQTVLAQLQTAGKGHELAAAEQLLDRLPLLGRLVTGDA